MSQPEVSVIVPVFNTGPYVAQCLDSILSQEGVELEVICVDGLGEDDAMERVAAYAARDKRVRIARPTRNLGIGGNRNLGLDHAKGEYFTCVDSDDWLLPGMLAQCHKAAVEHAADSVCCKHVLYLEQEGCFALELKPSAFDRLTEESVDDALSSLPVMTWGKLYRTDIVRENHIRWPEHIFGEDLEFFFNFYSLFPKARVINQRLYVYRQRANSVMDGIRQGRLDDMNHIGGVARRTRLFLDEKGVFQAHKRAWCDFVAAIFETYLYHRPYKEKAISELRALLSETGFPAEYADSKYFGEFQAAYDYRGQPWWRFAYRAILPLVALIPFRKARRHWRYWLKVNCLERDRMKPPKFQVVPSDVLVFRTPVRTSV